MRVPLAGAGRESVLPVLGIAVAGGYVTLIAWATGATTYDVWGALLLAPVLVAVSLPVLRRVARGDSAVPISLLVTALTLKLLSSLARYWMSYVLYDGGADAERYHDAGVEIANALHNGLAWSASGPFPGTAFVEGLTGYIYWLIGPSRIGGFLFFSWLGFWGLLLFQRAFATAVPGGDRRRYALLVLFLPSLLFWPSSIGKEAWMTLCLGLGAYGAARLLARRPGGFLVLALGVGGVSLVRPHMAVLLFGGLLVGYLARPYSRSNAFGPLAKVAGVVLLVAVGSGLVTQAERFFGVSDDPGASVSDVLDATTARTNQGGSSFEATPVRSPVDLPMATVSVLLRPFPWEANSAQALAVSAESALLIALAWRARRRLRGLPQLLRRQPYVAFALTYTLLFVVAFSSFANFGILTRQRVQVFPFFLVLFALPELSRQRREREPHVVPAVPAPAVRPAERVLP